MSPELLSTDATLPVPSTKTWLLLLSLLTMLLLVGSRLPLPAHGATPPVLTGSPAHGARSAALSSGGRVALKSPAPRRQSATTFAAAIAL